MADERFEQLLKGYELPPVSRDLDRRVLREGADILERARARVTIEEFGRSLLQLFGFGYLTWLMDLATTTDAEYRVEFI